MKHKTSQSGFTLIELIAVMVILGILAAVIIPRITTITSGAYESNVRNMYGLIKNEVTAQAVKAAMSGNFLETYPDVTNTTDDATIGEWVADYDPDSWSQMQVPGIDTKIGDNSLHDVGNAMALVNAVVFMYHPHGKPANSTVLVMDHAKASPVDGTATSKEDIYFIIYYPRTSLDGYNKGRDLDGFVMHVVKDGGDKDLLSTTTDAGAITAVGDDEVITDLSYCLCPSG